MRTLSVFLAETGVFQWLTGNWRQVNTSTRQYVVFFGSVTALAVVALIWATCFRKTKRRHRLEHRAPNGWGKNPKTEEPLLVVTTSSRRRKRRREHRPRNPTLAETGGMPPLRTDDSRDNGA
jgi:hypothetical protein